MARRVPRRMSGARPVDVSPGEDGRTKVRMSACVASPSWNKPGTGPKSTVEVITRGDGHPVCDEHARPDIEPVRVMATMPLTRTTAGSLAWAESWVMRAVALTTSISRAHSALHGDLPVDASRPGGWSRQPAGISSPTATQSCGAEHATPCRAPNVGPLCGRRGIIL